VLLAVSQGNNFIIQLCVSL